MLSQYLPRREQPESLTPPVFWLLVVLIGAVSGVVSGLLIRLLHTFERIAYNGHTGSLLVDVVHASYFRRVAVMTLAGIVVSVFLALERRLKIAPVATRAATTVQTPRTIPTLAEAFVSILTVGMGTPLGREAALREAASLIAARMSERVGSLTVEQRRLLIACGAGAGMGAAYNVPFAGALFGVEIVLGVFSLQAIVAAAATSCIATACSWLLLPNAPAYRVPALPFTVAALLFAVLAGPLCGVATSLFVRLIAWACRHRPRGSFVLIAPILVLTCVGVASLPYPELLGNGKEAIQSIFSNPQTISALTVLLFLRPIATVASLRSGAVGGLFTPAMSIGAILGSLIAGLWNRVSVLMHLVPIAATAADDAMTFTFIGAGATLAAATQAPFSAVFFLLEMTHRGGGLLLPLLIAVVLALLTHRRLTPGSIFTARRSQPTAPQLSENSCASSS